MRDHDSSRIAVAAAAEMVLSGATAAAASAPAVAKTARNAKLPHAALVNRAGHRLHSLSADRHGRRFICTDEECLSFWTPLTVRRGTRPKGTVGSLETIRRPDGKTQVSYRGRPLDGFYQDGRGEATGEGFKDVGTCHAVVPSG